LLQWRQVLLEQQLIYCFVVVFVKLIADFCGLALAFIQLEKSSTTARRENFFLYIIVKK
jgi:hypothetical protein